MGWGARAHPDCRRSLLFFRHGMLFLTIPFSKHKISKIIRARAHPNLRSPLTPRSNHGAPGSHSCPGIRVTAKPGLAHQPRTSLEMGGPWGPRAHPNLASPFLGGGWYGA